MYSGGETPVIAQRLLKSNTRCLDLECSPSPGESQEAGLLRKARADSTVARAFAMPSARVCMTSLEEGKGHTIPSDGPLPNLRNENPAAPLGTLPSCPPPCPMKTHLILAMLAAHHWLRPRFRWRQGPASSGAGTSQNRTQRRGKNRAVGEKSQPDANDSDFACCPPSAPLALLRIHVPALTGRSATRSTFPRLMGWTS